MQPLACATKDALSESIASAPSNARDVRQRREPDFGSNACNIVAGLNSELQQGLKQFGRELESCVERRHTQIGGYMSKSFAGRRTGTSKLGRTRVGSSPRSTSW